MHIVNLPDSLNNCEILLNAKEVQLQLSIGPTTLNKFVHLRWLQPVRFSTRLVRYRSSEVNKLIEQFSKNCGEV